MSPAAGRADTICQYASTCLPASRSSTSSQPRSRCGSVDSVSTRLFGTDGVRGVAGLAPLDPETIARLGRAIVRTRHTGAPVRIVVGRDTRESGGWMERALAEGAASAGAVVTSAGVVPTPTVAY